MLTNFNIIFYVHYCVLKKKKKETAHSIERKNEKKINNNLTTNI